MKKIIIPLMFLLLLTGCDKKVINKKIEPVTEKEQIEESIQKYVDDNPIKIGLYDGNSNAYKLMHEYSESWILNKDILVFTTYFTNEEEIQSPNVNKMLEYINKYENISDYRIGYNLSFELNDGTKKNINILKPSDAEIIYDYFQVYLYDNIYHMNDSWYSHITNEEFNENTLMTTIKLTGCTKTDDVKSPLKLSVFTYNDQEDFDENNNYRGNSIHTVTINRQ